MSKYQPLQVHLARHQGREAPMSFAEVERVLGFALPASARAYPAWWSNNHGTNVAVSAWRNAGFRTSRIDLGSERLVFVRDAAAPAATGVEESGDVIFVHRARLAPAALRLLDDLVEEGGSDPGEAAASLINAAAMDRRRRLLDEFAALSPRVEGSSADLIREDRDGR